MDNNVNITTSLTLFPSLLLLAPLRAQGRKKIRPDKDTLPSRIGVPYSPMNRAAIVFMISLVPAKIRVTRMSRHARAIGYSSQ